MRSKARHTPTTPNEGAAMRQTKLLGLAFMALFALTGILAASASAAGELPNLLPEVVTTATTQCVGFFKFGNGLIHLLTQEKNGCSGTQETLAGGMEGTFKTTFLGVKDTTGRSCSTKGGAKGEVVVSGTFDTQAWEVKAGELKTVSTTRPKEFVITCGTLEITVKGCTAGQLSPENKLTKELKLTFEENGKGDNTPVSILRLDKTKNENCENLSKTDAGAFALSSQSGVNTVTKFMQGGKEVEVLLMPL
jgi:hypothetical protein